MNSKTTSESMSPSTSDIIEAEILKEEFYPTPREASIVYLSPVPIPPSQTEHDEIIQDPIAWDEVLLDWATSPWSIAGATLLLAANCLLGWALRPENNVLQSAGSAPTAIASTSTDLPVFHPTPNRVTPLALNNLSSVKIADFSPRSRRVLPAYNLETPAASIKPSLATALLPPSLGTLSSPTPRAIARAASPDSPQFLPLPASLQPAVLPPPPPLALPSGQQSISQTTATPAATPSPEQQRWKNQINQHLLTQNEASESFYHRTQKQLQTLNRQNSTNENGDRDSVVERLQQKIRNNQQN